MILNDDQINVYITEGLITVDPFDPSLINPSSLDLRLGNVFTKVKPSLLSTAMPGVIDPTNKHSIGSETYKNDKYVLMPGEFILSCLLENITLPDYVSAEIRGKSSLGRLGLDNSSVAGWIDAGWSGVLTIELVNHGHHPILLTKGMKIGQMVFHTHAPALYPYNKKATSKYMYQEPGQGSKGV